MYGTLACTSYFSKSEWSDDMKSDLRSDMKSDLRSYLASDPASGAPLDFFDVPSAGVPLNSYDCGIFRLLVGEF